MSCAFIIFIPTNFFNTVAFYPTFNDSFVLSLNIYTTVLSDFRSGFSYLSLLFSKSSKKKIIVIIEEFLNGQEKRFWMYWYYLFRDPYFLYLKEFLFLDIWISKPISIVIVSVLRFYYVDLYKTSNKISINEKPSWLILKDGPPLLILLWDKWTKMVLNLKCTLWGFFQFSCTHDIFFFSQKIVYKL